MHWNLMRLNRLLLINLWLWCAKTIKHAVKVIQKPNCTCSSKLSGSKTSRIFKYKMHLFWTMSLKPVNWSFYILDSALPVKPVHQMLSLGNIQTNSTPIQAGLAKLSRRKTLHYCRSIILNWMKREGKSLCNYAYNIFSNYSGMRTL